MAVRLSAPRRMALLLTLPATLAGCESTFRGEPELLRGATDPLTETVLEASLGKKNVGDALGSSSVDDDAKIVLARMAEIDLLYNQYETDLLTESQQSNLGFSLIGLVTSAGGTIAEGVAARNLALTSTLAQGARTAYSKEVLAERTINALVSQMRASRALIRADIYNKLGNRNYHLTAALGDLQLYRQAGTLSAAFVELGETAATAQRENRAVSDRAEQEFFGIVSNTVVVRDEIDTAELGGVVRERKNTLSAQVRDGDISAAKVNAVFSATFQDAGLTTAIGNVNTIIEGNQNLTEEQALRFRRTELSALINEPSTTTAQLSSLAELLE